ncbi:MAG: serpin family protein [Bacteroidales bacterium]|nr:serpin family protein [Bacteroidales bacterium]
MRKLILYIFGIALLGLSCEKNPGPSTGEPVDIHISAGGGDVIESSNEFGFDLFNAILADEPVEKNVMISPVSISLALAMTYNGANGDTEDSMAYALRMDHLSSDDINLTYKELMEGLKSVDEKVIMEIANSIWYRQDFNVEQGFLDINQQYYNAEISELDFSSPDARDIINNWVSDHTHGKIPSIVDYISPDDVMFLINAIYFNGIWKKEFDPESTSPETFILPGGTTKIVDMMNMKDTIDYMENDLMQMAELDYGRGNYSMLVMLPKGNLTPEELAQRINTESWQSWLAALSEKEVTLLLPKFTFDYEKRLNDVLSLMGMGIAFNTGKADFTGIYSPGGLFISRVKHKTFIEVDEEGTEAAAATVVAISYSSYDPSEVFMTVNKPFLFAIREKTTNAIVFIGKVAEPQTE